MPLPPLSTGLGRVSRGNDMGIAFGAGVLALVAAVAWTYLAYRTSPAKAAVAPVGAVLVGAVAWRPMIGVYLGLLCVPLERLAFASAGADITPAKALFFLAGMLALARLMVAESGRRPHVAFAPFAGLLVVMTLGLFVSDEPFATLKIVVQWTAYLGLAMLVATASERELRAVLACLAISGAIVGVIAVTTAGPQEVTASGQAATGRAQAGFAHPAILAFFLVLAFAPTLGLAFRVPPVWRLPLAGAAAVTLAGIMLSLTRGGIVGVAGSMVVMLWWSQFRRVAAAILVVMAIFTAFNLGAIQQSQQLQVIGERLQSVTETRATANNQRALIWSKTPAIIADNPFIGVGAGGFRNVSPAYGIVGGRGLPFVHAHNIFLTVAAESGIIGLALLLAFFGALAASAVRLIASFRKSPVYPLGLSLAAGLAGLIVCSIADYPWATLVIFAVFMVEVGAFIAATRLAGAGPATTVGGNARGT